MCVCEGLIHDQAFLFPWVHNTFLMYLPDENTVDLTDVCIKNSRLLTYLGHEFNELLSSQEDWRCFS